MSLAPVFSFLTKDGTKSGLSVYLSSKSASVYKVAFDHDQYKNSHRSWLENIMQYHQFGVCIKGEVGGG